jgi:methionyl-tRNA synthetase
MKYYITTPIYYVNDVPHIGHAYTTIAADVLARWNKMHKKDVMFLTGTDEHGAKIVQAAEKKGQSPKDFCDFVSSEFRKAWTALDIEFNDFIRTTEPRHEAAVQRLLTKLNETGDIYKKKYEGMYCVQCEKFLMPGDLNEDLCCPDHKQKPVTHSEENYFFRLSKYQDKLLALLSDPKHPQHITVLPQERRNEIIGKLKLGLEDISISRAKLEWGIPLPFDASQTAYVWVDALINYISALGYAADDKKFKAYWPADLHLVGKDILWFHSVIWPAMLLACGIELPKKIFAHGFFTIDKQKMSKTIGNVIRPEQMIERFGADASRYLTLSLFPFGSDGDISWTALTDKFNVDLANNIGNLLSRTVTMIGKYFDFVIPDVDGSKNPYAPKVLEALKIMEGTAALYEECEFNRILEKIQNVVDLANELVETSAPWKMAKEKNPGLGSVLFPLLQLLGIVSVYLTPFMPKPAQRMWETIGQKDNATETALAGLSDQSALKFPTRNRKLEPPKPLFPRINPC